MTYIKRIIIQGFKSFGRRTVIDLNPGFSCIIGPNGAGKSNILDALCFVLGKTSAKGLRVERASHLIYNGGKTGKPATSARVSLILDNSNKIFPVEGDLEIARILKQNGQSTYKINGKTTTRQQVLEILSLAKIRPEGYNIILQGDITRFIDMTPLERRKVLEDASGIYVYEEKKEKALRELARVEERIHEANIVLAERKAVLEELEKDYKTAKRYKDLESKIKRNKKTLLVYQKEKKEKEKGKVEKEIEKNQLEADSIKKKLVEIEQEIKKKKEEIEKINKEIEARGEKDQVETHRRVETFKVELAVLKEKLLNLENELMETTNRKKQLEEEYNSLKEKISRNKNEIKTKREMLQRKEREYKEIERRIEELKKESSMDRVIEIEKEIEEIEKKIEGLEQETSKMREEEQELVRRQGQLEAMLENMNTRMERIKQLEKEHKEQVKKLEGLKKEFTSLATMLSNTIDHDSELAKQISHARQVLDKKREELAKKKTRAESIAEIAAGDLAIKKVLARKLQGVYGTIGQLGSVEKKYNKAMTIAVGRRIKDIVIEDDKIGEEIINYLKRNKIGVVNLLPLKNLNPPTIDPRTRRALKIEGVEGLAIDLISYDKKYEKAFRYILGNTLIVRDIETARRVGIGKGIRMVTLDGDLIEAGGAMRGGFVKETTLGFKEKEIMQEISILEKEIDDQERLLRKLEEEREENQRKIEELRNRKAEIEGEIIKLEKSLHISIEDLEAGKEEMETIQGEVRDNREKLMGLRREIMNKTREIVKLKAKRQELKEKISNIRSPAKLAELRAFEEEYRKLEKEIFILDSSIKSMESELETVLKREEERIQKILEEIKKKDKEAINRKKELEQEIKEKEEKLKIEEKKEEEMLGRFKDLFKIRARHNDELNKLEEERIKLLTKIKEIEVIQNNLALEKARIVGELAGIEEELKQFEGIEPFKDKSIETAKREIREFERMIAGMQVNLRALETYEQAKKELKSLEEKKNILEKEKEDVIRLINEIETKKKEIFMRTFNAINKNFSAIFKLLSIKGQAFLELEDKKDPFNGGVMIKVRLKGSKYLDIRSLSGGEKTLTALAFIFALQEYEPAFFYIFDEVDAALDKRNSEKLGQLIAEYSKKAQYIVITHNDAVMENSHYLYGVSIDKEGISKITSLEI
ncbi:chromosome segregation protein SMC [Candidatus Woesearchaeota archaeon]|nr:chromosome segregation protein SMC [Candidatus Woesearchaeota archaeon]